MKISIIIPTFNEANNIAGLVKYLYANKHFNVAEIIVSDGGSSDDTLSIASEAGALAVSAPGRGRSAQMNYGATISTGDILYFLHADCRPPGTYVTDIMNAIQAGNDLGRYQSRFDSNRFILKINAWFTRFDFFICMGGDQTLFVKRSVFEKLDGFREEMMIMEEYDFCERARKNSRYKIMHGKVLISARKYETNSWLTVQRANLKVVRMYKNHASQTDMISTYKQMLSYRKNAF